jgi:hypothetical protein
MIATPVPCLDPADRAGAGWPPTGDGGVPGAWPARQARRDALDGALARFGATTLRQLEAVALLDRTDSKYLLTTAQLRAALSALAGDYLTLEIGGRRRHRYQTLYFDTPDFELFRRHHAGAALRHKVRSRTYADTGLSFFEVKGKNAQGRTLKHRLPTDGPVTRLRARELEFVAAHAPVAPRALEPKLWNAFERITLVGRRHAERLTFDLGLSFETGSGHSVALPGIVVAELKQHGIDRTSPFARHVRAARVQPVSVSKYCVGVSLLHGGVRHNAFKPTLRTLKKLMKEEARVW